MIIIRFSWMKVYKPHLLNFWSPEWWLNFGLTPRIYHMFLSFFLSFFKNGQHLNKKKKYMAYA